MEQTAVIIPARTGEHLSVILPKLKNQGAHVIVVRDRADFPVEGADTVLDSRDGAGFMAGKCRDYGLDIAIAKGFDKFVFIDEDCIPQDCLVSSHADAIGRSIPVISCGRRLEEARHWVDPRECGEAAKLALFNGSVVKNISLVKACLVTWTCNLGINLMAVNLVRRLMNRLYGEERLFPSVFDGTWGGEDSFLAYSGWALGIPMCYLPKGANAVKHKDHPRPSNVYNPVFVNRLDREVEKMRASLMARPLTISDITP